MYLLIKETKKSFYSARPNSQIAANSRQNTKPNDI